MLRGKVHCHGDEILQVSMEKLCLHLLLCFQDVSAQWGLPKELLKLTLSVACQVIGHGITQTRD